MSITYREISNRAFTLAELLVTISIITILGAITLSNLNSARSKSRDARRVSDLANVQVALEFYYNKHRTYIVSGGGSGGGGQGWLGYEDASSYPVAVTRVLYNEGLFSKPLLADPQGINYMIYVCNGGQKYSLSATKEKPTAEDIAYIATTCNGSQNPPGNTNSIDGNYGKNYAVGN